MTSDDAAPEPAEPAETETGVQKPLVVRKTLVTDTPPAGILALDHGPDRRWQLFVRMLTISMVALFLVFVGIIGYWLLRPDPFDPLEWQTVRVVAVADDGLITVPQVEGFEAPSFYDDDLVPLSFSFCSEADDEYIATGSSWFVNAETGDRYPLNTNVESVIRPGCITPRVMVEIPTQIRVQLEDLASGLPPSGQASLWYIAGESTPNQAGGVTSKWQSEQFLIIAQRRPS